MPPFRGGAIGWLKCDRAPSTQHSVAQLSSNVLHDLAEAKYDPCLTHSFSRQRIHTLLVAPFLDYCVFNFKNCTCEAFQKHKRRKTGAANLIFPKASLATTWNLAGTPTTAFDRPSSPLLATSSAVQLAVWRSPWTTVRVG